jgi:hypothetical protein
MKKDFYTQVEKKTSFENLPASELSSEGDPSREIGEKENNSVTKKKRGRPPAHGLSGKPIYRSFHEAKQRCTNAKNPDYPQYGGRGIEFRFQSVTELFDEIGDRPPGTTLDRPNTNRHYERGNVRWANATEQANNRRPASRYSAASWDSRCDIRNEYLQAARHWLLSIKAMNDHTDLTPEEVSFLEERHRATFLPRATFWENTKSPPDYVALPSINQPGRKTVLLANAMFRCRDNRGLLSATIDTPLKLNCSEEELTIINDFANGIRTQRRTAPGGSRAQTGLIYSGCNGTFSDNLIEGRLLATAGRLVGSGLKARVVLVADLVESLAIDDVDWLLQGEYLFLPDLDMWPSTFGDDRRLNYRLRDVLEERERNRYPTVVYFENPEQHELRSIFVRYKQANLIKVIPRAHYFSWSANGTESGAQSSASESESGR